jgi:hypothetical protein
MNFISQSHDRLISFPLHSSPNIMTVMESRSVRWIEHVARMERLGERAGFVEKHEGKRPLGIPRRRWEENKKTDLREIGWGAMDWIDLAQDRKVWKVLVDKIMNFPFP